MSSVGLLEDKKNSKQRTAGNTCDDWSFCDGGGGLVMGGGALLVGGGSVCADLGGVSTGDEVLLTSHPELAHCAPPLSPSPPPNVKRIFLKPKFQTHMNLKKYQY